VAVTPLGCLDIDILFGLDGRPSPRWKEATGVHCERHMRRWASQSNDLLLIPVSSFVWVSGLIAMVTRVVSYFVTEYGDVCPTKLIRIVHVWISVNAIPPTRSAGR
jgi:hypothetical protein